MIERMTVLSPTARCSRFRWWSSIVLDMQVVVNINLTVQHEVEGCTLFFFLAEHRGSARGPRRHSTAISTAFHGQPRTLYGLPRTLHGLPQTLHGLPQWNAAASIETPWRPTALAVAISTAFTTARSTAISTATHGKHRRHTTAGRGVQRKDPRQCLRHGGGHGICRGSCRGTSVGCHGWYHRGCHEQNRGTCHGHNRGTCRGSAMYNGKPRHLPWKPADFHDSPWKDPRKTTEVPRSLPRTSTKNSNNVHMCVRYFSSTNTGVPGAAGGRQPAAMKPACIYIVL